ncbi:Salicylate hydroxylase [Cladophialophora carrionii]|uniref:Salicylate hydroxylase n=1 Tax=Cladophialophora carrionii TaxID=86049 RepID=A0A1C1CZX4_9EURO|nr:Salicylate hydroxylase [Cladophialophora carrionii]
MPSAIDRPPLTVAVIGGGIGGLCTALSLKHHCGDLVDIDVYEQAPQYKEIGAGVGIGVNAAKLLHKIGLGETVSHIAGKRSGIWIMFRKFDDGSEVVTVPSVDTEEVKQLPVHRAEFLDLLVDVVKQRRAARLHTNKRCRKLTEQGDEVLIEFEDGSIAKANLVIGCDGIHSAVRAQFTSDNPEYSGRIAYRGLVPISEIESWWGFPTYSVTWLGKNRHFLCFPISQNKTLNIVAFVAEDEENLGDLRESWTEIGKREDVFEAFKGFEERVQKVIQLMPEQPSKWLINDRKPLDQWVYLGGKAVLLGDAAHAMTPHQGAGAGQAIEDGYILGRALQDYFQSSSPKEGALEAWAKLYQDVRLPRAQKVQRGSRDAVEIYQAQADVMKDLPFDECVPEIHKRVINRMKWIWTDDIDAEYDQAVKAQREAGTL